MMTLFYTTREMEVLEYHALIMRSPSGKLILRPRKGMLGKEGVRSILRSLAGTFVKIIEKFCVPSVWCRINFVTFKPKELN
jgi:hypothetical protein